MGNTMKPPRENPYYWCVIGHLYDQLTWVLLDYRATYSDAERSAKELSNNWRQCLVVNQQQLDPTLTLLNGSPPFME